MSCCICMGTIYCDNDSAITKCRHSFHLSCLLKAARPLNCPLCRNALEYTNNTNLNNYERITSHEEYDELQQPPFHTNNTNLNNYGRITFHEEYDELQFHNHWADYSSFLEETKFSYAAVAISRIVAGFENEETEINEYEDSWSDFTPCNSLDENTEIEKHEEDLQPYISWAEFTPYNSFVEKEEHESINLSPLLWMDIIQAYLN